jgi:hypothetical protein
MMSSDMRLTCLLVQTRIIDGPRADKRPAFSGGQQLVSNSEEANMQYKPKSSAALSIALGGLPGRMRVEVDPNIEISAKTVGQLRKLPVWPDNLVIITPQGHRPESAVKVSKATSATRFPPKQ